MVTKSREISQADLVGEKFGKLAEDYQLQSLIGEGAFSKVYKAVHKISKTQRCVKIISKKGIDEAELKLLVEEVKILRTLDHPNILKVLEFYQDEQSFYIVTEYLQGGELFDRIVASNSLTEKQAAAVMSQILSAVSYIHKHKIIHRDLKPENCIFESTKEDSQIKIIDFGTSTLYEEGKKLKQKLGTPYYIAPEVLKRNYDEKCDIWSCGVILYILLCGYPPFNGPSDKVIFQNVLSGQFTFPEDEWSGISEQAKNLVKKMLEYNPATRLSAEQCLAHEWFTHARKVERKISTKVMENLRTFKADCKLQKAVLLYIITYFDIKDEKEELLKTFTSLDLDHDGQLTRQELIYGYSKIMGKADAEKEVERIFKTIDNNNSGAIDFSEFCLATANRQKLLNNDRLEQVFKIFDKDGSGTISVEELKLAFGGRDSSKDKNDDVFIKELLKEFDANNDGEISLKEFKDMMGKFTLNQQEKHENHFSEKLMYKTSQINIPIKAIQSKILDQKGLYFKKFKLNREKLIKKLKS